MGGRSVPTTEPAECHRRRLPGVTYANSCRRRSRRVACHAARSAAPSAVWPLAAAAVVPPAVELLMPERVLPSRGTSLACWRRRCMERSWPPEPPQLSLVQAGSSRSFELLNATSGASSIKWEAVLRAGSDEQPAERRGLTAPSLSLLKVLRSWMSETDALVQVCRAERSYARELHRSRENIISFTERGTPDTALPAAAFLKPEGWG